MSPRERDLHKRQVNETNEFVARIGSGRKFLSKLAEENPGIIFTGGGTGRFITPEDEVTEEQPVTEVHLTKKQQTSGGMIKNESHHLRVYEGYELTTDEYKKGFGEGEEMKQKFLSHVPDKDNRKQISIPVEYPQAIRDAIDEHDLNDPR